jgi:predicted permease
MSLIKEWMNRIKHFRKREEFDANLQEELRIHMETRADELVDAGLPLPRAVDQARREFGPVARAQENVRRAWRFQWFEDVFDDLRYALRNYRRSPSFMITALFSLALGIGANSAIFSAANAVLWRTLPVADPQRLVQMTAIRPNGDDRRYLPVGLAEEWARNTGVFSDVVTVSGDGLSFSMEGGRAERIMGDTTSPNYFAALGIKPILGQGYSEQVREGHWAAEVVLSYRFWQQRFGGDPNVLGRTIRLNDYPFTIVGVSPPSFYSLEVGYEPQLRLPLLPRGETISQINQASATGGQITARLKPGVGIAEAQTVVESVFQQYLYDHLDTSSAPYPWRHVRVGDGSRGWQSNLIQFHEPLLVLLALAGVVLLIACTNLANMLLARATARRRELAVRAAIGAGRARLIRQMLAEAMFISLIGGALGIAVAYWAGNILFGFLPQGHNPIILNLDPDFRVLWFTAGITMLTGVLFGLVPAIQATRGQLALTLKSDSLGSHGNAVGINFRNALIVGQITFSLILIVVAGLFGRTLGNLRAGDLFNRPDKVLLFTLKPQRELYSPQRIRGITANLVNRISSIQGVQSAAMAENGPLGSRTDDNKVLANGGQSYDVLLDLVDPGFFETLGISLLAGRDFFPTESETTQPVVIVNDVFAREAFKTTNPLGQEIFLHVDKQVKAFQIVGVVKSIRYYDLHVSPPSAVFMNLKQYDPYMPTLHVRTSETDRASIVAAVRREFDAVDTGFPIFNIKTLEDRVNDSLSRERLVTYLATTFGTLALLLAIIGLYGIVGYSVTQRTREIGIRIALGASRGRVLWLVARTALSLAIAGIIAGLACGIGIARLVSDQLFGISVADPVTLAAAAGTMLVVAVLAACPPALRATRIDPLVALRHE